VSAESLDLEPIKARLVAAGYARPGTEAEERPVRDPGRSAQEARAALREHIIEDVWALIDAVEALRRPQSA
jgi:hypothetical protein